MNSGVPRASCEVYSNISGIGEIGAAFGSLRVRLAQCAMGLPFKLSCAEHNCGTPNEQSLGP